MSTRLIFSLGTGQYKDARYVLDGEAEATPFAAIATRALYDRRAARRGDGPVQEAYVLLTPESRAKNLPLLKALWDPAIPLHELDVPHGGSDEDLWRLFEAIAGLVEDGDRLVLDITHGFRSMPLIALLVVAYATAARRDARLAMLSYGAFEATRDGETPLYDLTPLADLLDWTAAVHHFDRGGDAQPLAMLIRRLNDEIQKRPGLQKDERPRTLSSLARQLDRFAMDLQTFRYEDAVASAASLRRVLERALEEPADRQAIRPLATMAPHLETAMRPFESASEVPSLVDLARHRQVLAWLLERGLYIPYVAMLSETLVGLAATGLGLYAMAGDDAQRLRQVHHFTSLVVSGAGKLLTNELVTPAVWRAKVDDEFGAALAALAPLELSRQLLAMKGGTELVKLAEAVRPVRNSLMHAGMSTDPAPEEGLAMREKLMAFDQAFRILPFLDRPVASSVS